MIKRTDRCLSFARKAANVCGAASLSLGLLWSTSQVQAAGWVGTNLRPLYWIVEGEDNGQRTYVSFDVRVNPDNCSDPSSWLRINGSTKKGQYLLSQLSIAVASGRQMTVNVSGCDDWNRPIIVAINLIS